MNSLVTAMPSLVPIFALAGGVNALAGVVLAKKSIDCIPMTFQVVSYTMMWPTCQELSC